MLIRSKKLGSPVPIRLKVIARPADPRTVHDQIDATLPVFEDEHRMEPDWACGTCGNILATGTLIHPFVPEAIRFLPYPTGGKPNVLSVSGEHPMGDVQSI